MTLFEYFAILILVRNILILIAIMLIIRLHREGKKNSATFRIVVTEKQNAAKGKFLEILGSYNPHLNSKIFKKERINYWLSKGAKTSDTAHNLLVSAGIIKGPKKTIKIKKGAVKAGLPAQAALSAAQAEQTTAG